MKEGKNGISRLSFTHIFKPVYLDNGIFVAGFRSIFEQMFGGAGSNSFKDFTKPWTITEIFTGLSKETLIKGSLLNYETFTGHLNFIWDTPSPGQINSFKNFSSGLWITVNLSKTFKSGFTLGFATKTDISIEELERVASIKVFILQFQ